MDLTQRKDRGVLVRKVYKARRGRGITSTRRTHSTLSYAREPSKETKEKMTCCGTQVNI
jgi:hypothetical protein